VSIGEAAIFVISEVCGFSCGDVVYFADVRLPLGINNPHGAISLQQLEDGLQVRQI